jgi:hypothetical protein
VRIFAPKVAAGALAGWVAVGALGAASAEAAPMPPAPHPMGQFIPAMPKAGRWRPAPPRPRPAHTRPAHSRLRVGLTSARGRTLYQIERQQGYGPARAAELASSIRWRIYPAARWSAAGTPLYVSVFFYR